MTNKSKHKSEAPNRYAKALLLSCNNDLDLKQTKNDFDDFIKTYNKVDELKLFFQTPLLNPLRKKQILLAILNKTKLCENFSNFCRDRSPDAFLHPRPQNSCKIPQTKTMEIMLLQKIDKFTKTTSRVTPLKRGGGISVGDPWEPLDANLVCQRVKK